VSCAHFISTPTSSGVQKRPSGTAARHCGSACIHVLCLPRVRVGGSTRYGIESRIRRVPPLTMLACVSVPPVPWGGSSLLHARVVYHPQAALRLERLAREEAEQTLQAEREVMLAVQQMQQQQTVQRARAHVDAQRETAEAMTEAEAAARLLTRSGAHLSESAAAAAAAGTCPCRVTPSRLVLAASFVCAMVMARRPACSAVRACQELERERERARPMPYAPWLTHCRSLPPQGLRTVR
jgi:hypothetical protein